MSKRQRGAIGTSMQGRIERVYVETTDESHKRQEAWRRRRDAAIDAHVERKYRKRMEADTLQAKVKAENEAHLDQLRRESAERKAKRKRRKTQNDPPNRPSGGVGTDGGSVSLPDCGD